MGAATSTWLGNNTILSVGGAEQGVAGVAKMQVTTAGNKRICLQPIGGGSTHRLTRRPVPTPPRDLPNITTPAVTTTTTTSSSSRRRWQQRRQCVPGGLHIHIIRLMDGQVQVCGPLEKHCIPQRPDNRNNFVATTASAEF